MVRTQVLFIYLCWYQLKSRSCQRTIHSSICELEKLFPTLYLKFLSLFGSSFLLNSYDSSILYSYGRASVPYKLWLSQKITKLSPLTTSKRDFSSRVGSLYKLCPNVIEAPWFRFQSGSTILVNPMLFGSGEIPREPISDLLVEEDFKQIKTSPRPFCRECHCCNMSIKCLN